MALDPNQNNEKKLKIGGVESVEDLIAKRQAEKASEGAAKVAQQMEGVKGEVADVMAGMEAVKDTGPSEKAKDKKGDGLAATQTTITSDDSTGSVVQGVQPFAFPTEKVMVEQVRKAIQAEINAEMKRAEGLKNQLANGKASEFNESMAKVRTLQTTLSSLLNATFDLIKNLYSKYFNVRASEQ